MRVLLIYFLVSAHFGASFGQDYVLPLGINTELVKENNPSIKSVTKSGQTTFDSTFVFIPDTLSLPIFDEFSRNRFQRFSGDFDDPTVTSQLFYKLLDPVSFVELPNNTFLTDSATFRVEINLIDDTIINHPFPSVTLLFNPLQNFPVTYDQMEAYPPYIVIDTVATFPTTPDTIFLTNPLFVQDSARIFLQELDDPDKIWLNKQAYHNYRFAKNPWSLGVVTFDGLDENGFPYIFSPTTAVMMCDTLLSKPVHLDKYQPSDSVYFSFLYQTEGYGDVPEDVDSLILQFYNPVQESWSRVWSAPGEPVSDFKVAHIPVTDPEYFQPGFQFMFMNYGSPAGALDHFHIDYVDFRPFSARQDTLFRDFAFVYPISTMLKDYISVPWKHYVNTTENKMSDSLKVVVRNGSELPENNQAGNVRVEFDGQLQTNFPLNATLLSGGNINYSPRTSYVSYHDFSTSYEFDRSVDNDTSATFQWIANASAQFPSYLPNDSTFGEQVFENYYAYDDGSAEKAYGVIGVQSQLAYQFKAYQPDSLIAVQMHFVPTVNDVSNSLFLLAVWNDNNGQPGTKIYEDEFFFPKQPVYKYGPNGFHTYFFEDTMKVPVDEVFYIGWRQIDEPRLNIGFDCNHNNQDKIFWSVDGGNIWNNANYEGSMLMRPVVTSNLDFTLGIPEETKVLDTPNDFTVYPNPANSYFQISWQEPQPAKVVLRDINGRTILEAWSDEKIDISTCQKGIYLVSLMDNNGKVGTKKLVIH